MTLRQIFSEILSPGDKVIFLRNSTGQLTFLYEVLAQAKTYAKKKYIYLKKGTISSFFHLKKVGMSGWVRCSALARVMAIGCSTFYGYGPDFMTIISATFGPKNIRSGQADFLGQFLWLPKLAISLPNHRISLPKPKIILGS